MNGSYLRMPLIAAMVAGVTWVAGCASSTETAQRDELTAHVGVYPPPPAGIAKARVGVPPFQVQADRQSFGGTEEQLERLASDQMTTLLHQTQRFAVIERGQLEQLMREQNLEGIVKSGELAKPAQVRGVDYLLIGKVTNFRVKADRQNRGMDVGTGGLLGGRLAGMGGGFSKEDVRITTDCGVDIRLVDPTTGEVAVAHFGEFKRTDAASAMGLNVMSFRSDANADIQIQADDAGKILRLAFDDALRKMIPEIDSKLAERQRSGPAAALPVNQSQKPAVTVEDAGKLPANAAGKEIFCSECGKKMSASAKFCPSCGAKNPAVQ